MRRSYHVLSSPLPPSLPPCPQQDISVLAVNVSRNSFDRKRLEGLVPPEWLDVSERG